MSLEGYNFFRPLCSPGALRYWKDSRPSSVGGPGQMCWVESEQRWVNCNRVSNTNSAAARTYQPGEMVWFESIQRWVSADLIEAGDYTPGDDSVAETTATQIVFTVEGYDDYVVDFDR